MEDRAPRRLDYAPVGESPNRWRRLLPLLKATVFLLPVLFFAALIAMGFIIASAIAIPPSSKTDLAMHAAKRRILRYAAAHDQLPTSLYETAPIPESYDSLKDAWGRDLFYRIEPNGDVTLVSLGEDNAVGGTGDDRDMVGSFSPKKPDGTWSDELIDWKVDPFRGSTATTRGYQPPAVH